VRTATALARGLYRVGGGRITGPRGLRTLLLTTRGRRSGRPRTVPLCYVDDGDALAVVASFGGADVHPDWYLNLLANPHVTVRLGRAAPEPRRARDAAPDERERLWARFVAGYAGYERYARKTTRTIPVVVLERP
jgi:deazaflavin-dependent oxidoreductase (nitroreductase family)